MQTIMKKTTSTATAFVLGFLGLVQSEAFGQAAHRPRHYAMVIDERQTVAERTATMRNLVRFISEGMCSGDRISLYELNSGREFGRPISIPEGDIFKNPKAVITRLNKDLQRLKHFPLKAEYTGYDAVTEFINHFATQVRNPSEEVTLIIVAPPFFSEKTGDWNFGSEGTYPSDGVLELSPLECPLGTKGFEKHLEGAQLVWIYPASASFHSESHRLRVQRFWGHWTAKQGGKLTGFSKDESGMFQRAAAIHEPLDQDPIQSDSKPEIVRFQGGSPETMLEGWIGKGSKNLPKATPTTGKPEIALVWGQNNGPDSTADLDLYVQTGETVAALNYRHISEANARFRKDFASLVPNGLEGVSVFEELPLRNLRIAVNFYSGRCPGGVPFKVNVKLGDSVFEYSGRTQSSTGNHGLNWEGREGDPYWTVIDVKKLLRIQ
jgi:hypothetical protein